MDKIKGVNLGNWLVLEKWMEPDLFEGTDAEDETWLARRLDKETFAARLKKHRDSYITKKDFEFIKKQGMNTVRIPVPYFIFGDHRRFVGCIEYLDKAFKWANEYDLKVIIDMHTSPGNQNGYDNGGLVGVCKWHKNPKYVRYIIHVLMRLAKRYASDPALFGIEVLNEPISFPVYMTSPCKGKEVSKEESKGSGFVPMSFLTSFYKACYRNLRKVLPEEKAIIFHDGFRLSLWNCFFRQNKMKNVYLDAHIYVSAMETFMNIYKPWIYKAYLGIDKLRLKAAAADVPIIIGEWCICNGYANDMPRRRLETAEYEKAKARRYREVAMMELDTWEPADGWVYWSYKLYSDPSKYSDAPWKESWDFTRCVKNKWLVF